MSASKQSAKQKGRTAKKGPPTGRENKARLIDLRPKGTVVGGEVGFCKSKATKP